jgi:hypothetical protein
VKKLDSLNTSNATPTLDVDSHTKLLIQASANRIAGTQLWTRTEILEKLPEDIFKATYASKNLKLIIYAN